MATVYIDVCTGLEIPAGKGRALRVVDTGKYGAPRGPRARDNKGAAVL
jgi:hypothetical protein